MHKGISEYNNVTGENGILEYRNIVGRKKEFPNTKIKWIWKRISECKNIAGVKKNFRIQKYSVCIYKGNCEFQNMAGVKRISECKNVADVKRNFRIQNIAGV